MDRTRRRQVFGESACEIASATAKIENRAGRELTSDQRSFAAPEQVDAKAKKVIEEIVPMCDVVE